MPESFNSATPGKKKPKQKPGHERWVISYADLLTLLLALFVVLYASSHHDQHKLDQAASGFVSAFHGTPVPIILDFWAIAASCRTTHRQSRYQNPPRHRRIHLCPGR